MYHHVLISFAAMALGPPKATLKQGHRYSCMFVFQDISADFPQNLAHERVRKKVSSGFLVWANVQHRFTGEISDMTGGHHDIPKSVWYLQRILRTVITFFGEDERRSLVNNERQIYKGGGLKCRCRGTAGGNVEKNVEKGGKITEKDRKK